MIDKKPPYKYSREEYNNKLDELKQKALGGPCSASRYNGKIDHSMIAALSELSLFRFGVDQWLYKKALEGCEESLFKLDHCYSQYDEVINKAKEEGLI